MEPVVWRGHNSYSINSFGTPRCRPKRYRLEQQIDQRKDSFGVINRLQAAWAPSSSAGTRMLLRPCRTTTSSCHFNSDTNLSIPPSSPQSRRGRCCCSQPSLCILSSVSLCEVPRGLLDSTASRIPGKCFQRSPPDNVHAAQASTLLILINTPREKNKNKDKNQNQKKNQDERKREDKTTVRTKSTTTPPVCAY